MAQIPPIDDAYINEIIKSNGPYNPALLKTQGIKMRELIKWLRDRMEQGDAEAVHKTGDESISGTKTFTLIKAEGLSINNLGNPSLDTVISPITGVQTKLLNITEGAFSLQLSASVLAASRSQLLQDKDGVIALTEDLSDFLTLSQFNEELALKIDITAKGVAGGVSTLDSGGKIPASQLPDSISGALTYQGTWDAVTNVPALVDPPAFSTKGYYYVTNTAGTQFGITFAIGDWIVSNGTAWEKVDNSDAVTTVFGRLGNVLANEEDYSAFYPFLTDKQNSLITDGTGVKFPTVDAIIAALATGQTIGANTTGNATTASKLAIARTINGVAFDGTDDITLPGGGITTITAIGSTPNANGASISGNALTLQPASAFYGGVVTTAHQSFQGVKSFLARVYFGEVGSIVNASGSYTKDLMISSSGGYTQLFSGVNNSSVRLKNDLLSNSIIREYSFPNASGTLALASDLAVKSLTTIGTSGPATLLDGVLNIPQFSKGGVPYYGATGPVNLGAYDLRVNAITVGRGGGGFYSNVVIGGESLLANTTGLHNVAVGNSALRSNTTGNRNVAMGLGAMLINLDGHNNTAMGDFSLSNNTNGQFNTSIGSTSLDDNTTGSQNTSVGGYSLSNNATGSFNTAIGFNANVSTSELNNATAIGSGAVVNASNKIQLGNIGVTLIETSGAYQGAQFRLSALNTAPASATATGTIGEIRVTANYIYVCTATNTWVRSALASW